MQARLSTSKKWSAIPRELVTQIKTVFKKSFQQHIGSGTVTADGRIYPEEIVILVGVKLPEQKLRQSNWLVSIGYKKGKDDVIKLLNLAVDAQGSLFEQFFTSENDHDFPRIWQEVDFEGTKIYIQYSTENPALESEANKFLGINEGDELLGGEWEDLETPEMIKAKLGLADADVNDLPIDDDFEKDIKSVPRKPTSGKPKKH